jgi:ribosome modulation factor
MGFNPILSEVDGFPHTDGMPPYASCLKTMDECAMVIGVIERQYGTPFDDWGPFPQYKGLAPTHAELRHALNTRKRVLIYVPESTWDFYEVWRRNPDAFAKGAPHGLDVRTLEMFHELKTRSPAPWLSRYSNASSVVASLKSEIINQLYQQLREREKETADLQQYLLGKLDEAPPEVRQGIAEAPNSDLVASRDALKAQLAAIEAERVAGASDERIRNLEQAKLAAEMRLSEISRQFGLLQNLLARSAAKDAVWLEHVRSTLMPKQPGRAPFHNSLEVALRGYHASPGRRVTPVLSKVTWEKLPHVERGLHRGYYAGIIFHGSEFVPGVRWTSRRCKLEGVREPGQPTPWMLPNIYYGDYLEVASSDDPIESPLSHSDYEYQVRNPEGQTSEWVRFSYPFDDAMLEKIRVEQLELGRSLLARDKPVEAVEPMRKARFY